MRFLWVVRSIPLLPDDGASIYSNGLIRALLKTGATGTLVGFGEMTPPPSVEGLRVRSIPSPSRNRIFSLASSLQSDAFRLQSRELAGIVDEELAQSPDVVITDYFAMGWLLPNIEIRRRALPILPALVYISHNHEPTVRRQVASDEENPLKRFLMRVDAEKGARLDQNLVRAADLITVNTEIDEQLYREDAPSKKIVVLKPAYDGEIIPTRPITHDLPRRVVITGSFDWIAKLTSLTRFLEAAEVPFERAGIEIVVVGRGRAETIEHLRRKYPFATFTGRVDDVRPYLADARIGIMPDEVGGGFKHKYLYYIFAGIAVATIRSQFIGIPVDPKQDVISAATIENLVDAVVACIDDVASLEGMRIRCWNACAREFNWIDRGQHLRQAMDSVLTDRHSPPKVGG